MRKTNQRKYVKLQKKREGKRLKRLSKIRLYKNAFTPEFKEITFKKTIDQRIINDFSFQLDEFLNEHGNKPSKPLSKVISIPLKFSLEDNYDETVLTLSLIRRSILHFLGNKFIFDFSNCVYAEFSALFLLKVILDEYIIELKRLQEKLLILKASPDIVIQHSSNEDVNWALVANAIIKNVTLQETNFIPISNHNMITGRKTQKHYHENKKGKAVTSLRQYINQGLKRHGFELNASGEGYFDGLISEVLNNAEDHSTFDRWYAFANLFETNRRGNNSEIVGEINLAFLNFGPSIFEGFEITKNENSTVYEEMSAMCDMMSVKKGVSDFTRENLFTLYALQDGNSRLKYEKESRGTGTMKFVNSFLSLGDYQDAEKGYIPRLLIFSGSTVLKCDNAFKPFALDGVFYLSLNNEEDMTRPPVSTHLKTLGNRFPGTLITSKIYLNQNHLNTKIDNGSEKN